MAPKLSDSDKSTIVELYQQPDESTATLASRYGVSSSTISRILKQSLSGEQYKEIVKQKKGGGSKPQAKEPEPSSPEEPSKDAQSAPRALPIDDKGEQLDPHTGAEIGAEPDEPTVAASSDTLQLSITDVGPAPPILKKNSNTKAEQSSPQPESLAGGWGDQISSEVLDLGDLEDDDLEEEDLDDDLEDDLDDEDDTIAEDEAFSDLDGAGLEFSLKADRLSVLPFSEAKLPRTCYLIIDKAAELITRPLKAFSDLGEVPADDINEQTLPVFDNHRVAKRFVNRRTQRIVKVPDSQVLRKTSSYLLDKGITRLLLGGQVYALMDDEPDDYGYGDDDE
ncbi:MAG: helix-turn-helix domain-containing protein [Leptolyngbyaceae cyanobacterium]